MLQRCPECGGPLAAAETRSPREEPEYDQRLAPTAAEDAARARSEGPDWTHRATDLVCVRCGAVVTWADKDPVVPRRGA